MENKRCKIWFQCLYCMGARVPGARSPWWLNFVWWHLDVEVAHTDVWKFVHLFFNEYCTYTLQFWSSCRNQIDINCKILTAVRAEAISVMMLSSFIDEHQHSEGTCHLHFQGKSEWDVSSATNLVYCKDPPELARRKDLVWASGSSTQEMWG